MGEPGNEAADALAKEGARAGPTEPPPGTPKEMRLCKNIIKDETLARWSELWQTLRGHNQAKHWLPTLNKHKANQILLLRRSKASDLIALAIGFNKLRRHMKKLDPTLDLHCQLCRGGTEDTLHLLYACPMTTEVSL